MRTHSPLSNNKPRHTKPHVLPILLAILVLMALCPSLGYAQDSITELDREVNASGRERTGKTARVFSELGMGLVGSATAAGIAGGVLAIDNAARPDARSHQAAFFFTYSMVNPALTAGGVLLGGWLTGGRGKAWAPFAGAYIGGSLFVIGGLLGLLKDEEFWDKPVLGSGIEGIIFTPLFIAALVALPLAGAIVGYELSESHETDRLKSERNKLMQNSSTQTTQPIMFNLLSGSF